MHFRRKPPEAEDVIALRIEHMMAVKKILKIIIIIILLLLIVLNIRGVFWMTEGVGFGFLKEDGETVYYLYINHIVNVSLFPKTVTFEAFSYEDAESSFIKEAELKIVSVGIRNESQDPEDINYLPGNAMTLQPLKKYMICIECEGEYGGNGNGVRHPPDTIKYKIHHKGMENLVEASDDITVYFEEVEVAGYDYGNGKIACVQIEYPGKDAEYHERINGSIRRETVDFIASGAVCLKQFEFWYKEPMDWCLESYILGNQYLSIKYRVQNHLTRFNDAAWEYMCFVFDLETGKLVSIDDLVSLDEETIDIFAESVYPEYYRKLMGTEFVRYALSDRLRDSKLLYSEYLEKEGTAIFKGSFVLEKYGIRLTPGVNGDGSGGITFLIPYDAVRQAAVNEKFKKCLENVPEPGEEIIEPVDNRPSQKG